MYKSVRNSSPGEICKCNIQCKLSTSKRFEKCEQNPKEKVKHKRLVPSDPDCHYGFELNVPDSNSPEFEKKKDVFLKSLVLSDEDRNLLQVNTTAKGNCDLWKAERHK
ncbi:hypothetical protein PR048_005886 [Dryococelus australis]|uniref:Uncharacterized protein n=1 Tax=Dryococelus australis TaxID=614101 RepID=A0ABQ9I9F0_9NEOP|nr:hypothetical protein PR048_005886 [Dryococelus australis]